MSGYSAYVLTQESRQHLLSLFPPKYPDVIAHHVTVQFGIPEEQFDLRPAHLHVVGYCTDGDGIEALVVAVNAMILRPDGEYYHITWSLDRKQGYKPQMSNVLIKKYPMERIQAIPFSAMPEYVKL